MGSMIPYIPAPWILWDMKPPPPRSTKSMPAKMSSERFSVLVALDTPPCCIMYSCGAFGKKEQ